MNYWLMKSEPETFSIDDLIKRPKQTEPWEGVRNYQARNYLRQMKLGDKAFFYHSNCKEPGIYGIMEIVAEAEADKTAFDIRSSYYDPKSTKENPRWYLVKVRFVEKLKRPILLSKLKSDSHIEHLKDLALIRPGNRLSVMPVSKTAWNYISEL